MVQTNQRSGNYPSSKWCFGLVFRRQDDKGFVVVLDGGGWKLRCESLGSLRYFRHGLVERGGDIVQVVNGADKSRKGVGTKDAWLFWGGRKLRCESLGSLRYFLHGLVERLGDIVQVVNCADKSRNGVGTTLPPQPASQPEAASQWYVDCPEPSNHPKPLVVLHGGACLIEPITKDPLEGVLF